MPRKYNHVHKLQLHKYKNGTVTFFCILNCSFKIDPALALGKESICHKCGSIFLMNGYSIKLKFPHCEKCHSKKNKSNKIVIGSVVNTAEVAQSESVAVANDNPVESMLERMRQSPAKFETISEDDLL